jgi:ADP-L-glycero-D-manno-heptose 6-epimerase
MLIVTGGAGFIGSNLSHALAARGADVVVVDDLTDGTKCRNLVGAAIADYLDKDRLLALMGARDSWLSKVDGIFHLGACAKTTEWNGRLMMENNFEYSKTVLSYCRSMNVPLVYASSASVYGVGSAFAEDPANEAPLNAYAYSKLLFDAFVRRTLTQSGSPVVGLRYFNVYGPREMHKGAMASVAYRLWQELAQGDTIHLFRGVDGYRDGEQRRDFVHVDDVVNVNLWFFNHASVTGIFNVGTGRAETFNEVARTVLAAAGRGTLEYIPFPDNLLGHYQNFTRADLTRLRAAGCDVRFRTVAQGVTEYAAWLAAHSNDGRMARPA